LIYMAGGAESAIERVKPVLLAMGGVVHHVGPTGSGAWLKLAVNALFGTQVAAMAEQLALLRDAGVDLERALAALKAMPVTSPAAAGAATLMLAGNFAPQAPVDLIAKDMGYVLASSRQALPLTQTVAARLADAQRAGLGGENIVALSKLYR
jgi:3-hydroxyisobutyrate dehydrogenase